MPTLRPGGASAREALTKTAEACSRLPEQLRTPDSALAQALAPWGE